MDDVRQSYGCLRTVRTAKFVARKQWVVTGADDKHIRVYDHSTAEEIKSFEAHTDYIRRAPCPCPSALLQDDHVRPSFSHLQTASPSWIAACP